MSLRIISDIHLGHGASSVREVEQLAPLCDGVSSLVFNGDTVELRYREDRSEAFEQLSKLRALCGDQKVAPVFINGNHDPIISQTNHLDLSGGEVLVTHGDLLFHEISPWSREAEFIAAAHTEALRELAAERLLHLESRLEVLKRAALSTESHKSDVPRGALAKLLLLLWECWPPTKPLQILRVWAQTPSRAAALAQTFRPEARFVIMGHTHFAGVWERQQKLVINTGGFLVMARPLAVEIEGKLMTVRRIVKRQGQFHLGKAVRRFELAGN